MPVPVKNGASNLAPCPAKPASSRAVVILRQSSPKPHMRNRFASSPLRLSVAADRDAIVALGFNRRDVAGIEIALDQLERALGRRPVASSAAGLDADELTRLQ